MGGATIHESRWGVCEVEYEGREGPETAGAEEEWEGAEPGRAGPQSSSSESESELALGLGEVVGREDRGAGGGAGPWTRLRLLGGAGPVVSESEPESRGISSVLVVVNGGSEGPTDEFATG